MDQACAFTMVWEYKRVFSLRMMFKVICIRLSWNHLLCLMHSLHSGLLFNLLSVQRSIVNFDCNLARSFICALRSCLYSCLICPQTWFQSIGVRTNSWTGWLTYWTKSTSVFYWCVNTLYKSFFYYIYCDSCHLNRLFRVEGKLWSPNLGLKEVGALPTI